MEQYLEEYTDDVKKRAKQIVLETAQIIQSQAKALAPVDDGSLRDSITLRIENGGLGAVIHVGAFYAIYVNYGTGIYAEGPGGSRAKKIPWTYWSPKLNRWVTTSGMRAQEFWEPAVEIGQRHFIREMGRF
ncbi:HK97 gp10 family phage protein [Planococcus sp. ANT_H30]|uniref:HK97-gp10 family putative phage morphogenesis protein n=1 Tax=Planococcus sp. ANT_H30 TaxID=2597347 RepID=UPI0011EE5DF8|nr:HK97-gp10 family putative phage morphogenesis protein [Planococcus sp. ANT_H30]KAA0956632.1 HK97 gp10 family phage protein [Planococcus sp. ANT_H30]